MSLPQRIALYYAPALHDPLWSAAASWLGRNPETNAPVARPDVPGLPEITREAAVYGFHATLKPPMRLRAGTTWDAVLRTVDEVASGIAPFDLPAMAVADLHGFIALRETTPSVSLQSLADACIAGADALREPPDAEELARRRRGGSLTSAQEAMLVRWGYPYMFATWFFHMTLTCRLPPEPRAQVIAAARAHFAAALARPRRVEDICIFTQREAAAPFILADRIPLSG